MSDLSAVSLSGMNAAQAALDASASNLANLSTPGYRRLQVDPSTTAGGAVATNLRQASRGGNALETDLVGQLVAKNAFLANLAAFKTSDKMMGSLLDATG
ncbi:MAG: flagellar basal body rod protein [Burkholderiales bacterium]|nr:flagellar basal body rod protein [Burkholderiales bacterium]